jgi:hypothetical protein
MEASNLSFCYSASDGANKVMYGNNIADPSLLASCDVYLSSGSSPLGEDPNNDTSGALDENSNLTIDIGIFPPPPPGTCGSPFDFLILTNQDDVDAFPTQFPGCHYYRGWIIINGNDIENLDSLIYLEHVGSIIIGEENPSSTPNPLLQDLQGLNNLVKSDVYMNINNNPMLEDISALANLDSVGTGIYFKGNPLLTDVSPIQNISTVGYHLWFSHSNALTTFPDFSNLNDDDISLGFWEMSGISDLNSFNNMSHLGALYIANNPNLTKISGFQNLQTVGGILDAFRIAENPLLDSITGFGMLNNVAQNFEVYDNPMLSKCCGFVNIVEMDGFGNNIIIHDNLTGCMDTMEIHDDGPCNVMMPVAMINGEYYMSLDEALMDVAPGDTIHIVANITEEGDVTIPVNIFLELPSTFSLNVNGSIMNNGGLINFGTINLPITENLQNNATGLYSGSGILNGNLQNNGGVLSPGG